MTSYTTYAMMHGTGDEWTAEDSAAASAEGWDVFDVNGGEDMQIQRHDDPQNAEGEPVEPTFECDGDAWKHVVTQARAGSALHIKALKVISMDELGRIERVQGPAFMAVLP